LAVVKKELEKKYTAAKDKYKIARDYAQKEQFLLMLCESGAKSRVIKHLLGLPNKLTPKQQKSNLVVVKFTLFQEHPLVINSLVASLTHSVGAAFGQVALPGPAAPPALPPAPVPVPQAQNNNPAPSAGTLTGGEIPTDVSVDDLLNDAREDDLPPPVSSEGDNTDSGSSSTPPPDPEFDELTFNQKKMKIVKLAQSKGHDIPPELITGEDITNEKLASMHLDFQNL